MTSICFIKFIVMENSYYVLYSLCISPSTSLPIYPVYKVRNLSQSQQRKSLGEKFLSNHGLYPSFSLTALLQHMYADNTSYSSLERLLIVKHDEDIMHPIQIT